jgi:hypothetical protein
VNPVVIVFMIFATSLGFAISGDIRGAAIGLAVMSGLLSVRGLTHG